MRERFDVAQPEVVGEMNLALLLLYSVYSVIVLECQS